MTSQRTSIPKSVRFEVFKRDKFTCQYCGASAPAAVLEVDHIVPVARGGGNDAINLITSCKPCNAGKSARQLDDVTVIAKRKRQLDELQERREQLEMMAEWQAGLSNLDDQAAQQLASFWCQELRGLSDITELGLEELRTMLRSFSYADICDAMRASIRQYVHWAPDGPTDHSCALAWKKLPPILRTMKRMVNKPFLKDLYYIRAILRNRLAYTNNWQALSILERAYKSGVPIDDMMQLAKETRNWTEWRKSMQQLVEDYIEEDAADDQAPDA